MADEVLLIPLYDECINRPKLSEQKNPFDYSSSPHKWGRNNQANQGGSNILLYILGVFPFVQPVLHAPSYKDHARAITL